MSKCMFFLKRAFEHNDDHSDDVKISVLNIHATHSRGVGHRSGKFRLGGSLRNAASRLGFSYAYYFRVGNANSIVRACYRSPHTDIASVLGPRNA